MGIAAMMSSIDRSLVPVPALAPPSDSFAAKAICKIGPSAFEHECFTIDLDVCLQDDALLESICGTDAKQVK